MTYDPRVFDWNSAYLNSLNVDDQNKIFESKKVEAIRVIRILKLDNTQTIIDFGSGPGYIASHIAPVIKKLYCIDVSQSFIDVAKMYTKDHNNIEYIKINFADFEQIPQVDSIYCLALFIHFTLYDIFTHLTELYNCLKPGGQLFFDTRSDQYINFKSNKWLADTRKSVKIPNYHFTNLKYHNTKIIKQMIESVGFDIVNIFDSGTHSFFHIGRPYENNK